MKEISSYQLCILTIFYQIGTTIVFGFGASAGKDAWISAIISTIIGCVLIMMYTNIMSINHGLSLVEWWTERFGKILGIPIGWMYMLIMLYEVGRGVGDLRFLISATILPKTSSIVVVVLFMSGIFYAVAAGIEVIGRLGEFIFWTLILLFMMVIVLLFISKVVHLNRLLPIAGNGFKPILKAVWPVGITQSYGESIELAMIWPFVKEKQKITKISLWATISFGLIIIVIDVMGVAVLGGAVFKNSMYPVFNLVQQISIGEFITNLEAIEVLFLLTNIFFKMTIHTFGASLGVCSVDEIKKKKWRNK